MGALLEIVNISKYFGAFAAVKDLSFQIESDKIYGIAGPNGAGKTTLFNIITSNPYHTTSGKILFRGKEIQHLHPPEICHMGISRTFQISRVFEKFTYLENVEIGSTFGRSATASKLIQLLFKRKKEALRKRSIEFLDFVGLADKQNDIATGISLFDKKMLMLASVLATSPTLIMLDEPFGGLNEVEIEKSMKLIRKIHDQGTTVIVVEHNMKALMTLSEWVMIMHHGEKLCEGEPKDVREDKEVIDAYLGKEIIDLADGDTDA